MSRESHNRRSAIAKNCIFQCGVRSTYWILKFWVLVAVRSFVTATLCYCVQNFIKIRFYFTEIWSYNDFKDGDQIC